MLCGRKQNVYYKQTTKQHCHYHSQITQTQIQKQKFHKNTTFNMGIHEVECASTVSPL